MNTYNPTYTKGDTILIPLQWVDAENTPISFVGRVIRFCVRETEYSTSTLFDKTNLTHPAQINVLEVDDVLKKGLLEVTISSAETSLFPEGDLPYNLQLEDQDGFVSTILRGRLNILSDIAR